jgi:hypothetical protein
MTAPPRDYLLLTPMLDRVERLPGPQREALRTAIGLSSGRHCGRPGVDSAAVSRSVTLKEPGWAAGRVGRQSGLTAR